MDNASGNAAVESSLFDGEDEFGTPHTLSTALGLLRVERREFRAMVAHQTAWADLVERAADANVFLDPAFALPLVQHLPASDRPDFLLIWEAAGSVPFRRLVGLLPLMPRRSILGSRLMRGYKHEQAPLGLPLLDRARAGEVIMAMLDWLRAHDPNAVAVLFSHVPEDSVFHALVTRQFGGVRGAVRCLGEHQRAILRQQDRSAEVTSLTSAKRRKELRRQQRRLSELGNRHYLSARTPTEIAHATERFLALEHDGWKGRKGTSLLADPSLATFARAMTRLMALHNKCRIDSIEIDGRPVAMGIVLFAGDRAHFWKTAYDETCASLSPGVQFALELTEVQLADRRVALTDSCAMPDHPMIDRLWPERVTMVDLAINLRREEPRRFERIVQLASLARALRTRAKALRAKAKAVHKRFVAGRRAS